MVGGGAPKRVAKKIAGTPTRSRKYGTLPLRSSRPFSWELVGVLLGLYSNTVHLERIWDPFGGVYWHPTSCASYFRALPASTVWAIFMLAFARLAKELFDFLFNEEKGHETKREE